MSTKPIGYSYVRFSTPEQLEGDSLRRQTQSANEWCEHNGVHLDTSLSLRDLGVSAFKGKHRTDDKHALAQFLKLAERGRIPAGSYLVIENLDRLSREDERTALRLWMDLLDRKINIVQLTPETVFRHEKSDMVDIMRAIIELSRGHSESAIKSKRLSACWEEKRDRARNGKGILKQSLPYWIQERDGAYHLIPERAQAIRYVFRLAAAGLGQAMMVKRLRAEKIPAFGKCGDWTRPYLSLILRDRRAMGEYQPRTQNGKAEGEPIPNFFPAAVTPEEWHAARVEAGKRACHVRTCSKHVNVFGGLLVDAKSGDSYFSVLRNLPRGGWRRVLSNATGHAGKAKYATFPQEHFEEAILSLLAEIEPRELLDEGDAPDETLALAGELAGVEKRIAALEEELMVDDAPAAAVRVAKRLESKRDELAKRLAEAHQKQASPLAETWTEMRTLLETLQSMPDGQAARLRLRMLLRRSIEAIYLVVVPQGRNRLCAAQVVFRDRPLRRSYLIMSHAGHGNRSASRPARWEAKSFASPVVDLDLRDPQHAAKLEKSLASV
jgi:DNA invertase Pin-like site-specific DNA recombinase